ncbi:MAG: hypothetical protein J0M04_00960 [Verrucomicrobia bacterium]|nr:hypothetical protein [Verrucomicrobiota bacterium]
MRHKSPLLSIVPLGLALAGTCPAAVLYTNAGPISVDESLAGSNLPGLSLSRGSSAADTLYFKFTVTNPASNSTTENYYAGFQLWEGGGERLGVGNAWGAYAYSAFSTASGDLDLKSANPEPSQFYQLVRNTDLTTIVIRVDFVNGGNDNVTVWLNPDLGLTEDAQSSSLTTTFQANATFNEIHLREGGGGGGWTYSDIAIAQNGMDTGFFAVPESSVALLGGLGVLSLLRRRKG